MEYGDLADELQVLRVCDPQSDGRGGRTRKECAFSTSATSPNAQIVEMKREVAAEGPALALAAATGTDG